MTDQEYQDFLSRGGQINKVGGMRKKKKHFTDPNNSEHNWFNHLTRKDD